MEKIILGAGCFWCLEAILKNVKGIVSTTPGYCGGSKQNPTYKEVCQNTTGHKEVVLTEFENISLEDVLEIFFSLHDPTQINRQGADIGEQYQSVIYFFDDTQKNISLKCKQIAQKDFLQPISTYIEKATEFYPAEDYHKNYFENNPQNAYCQSVISKKLSKFLKDYKGK